MNAAERTLPDDYRILNAEAPHENDTERSAPRLSLLSRRSAGRNAAAAAAVMLGAVTGAIVSGACPPVRQAAMLVGQAAAGWEMTDPSVLMPKNTPAVSEVKPAPSVSFGCIAPFSPLDISEEIWREDLLPKPEAIGSVISAPADGLLRRITFSGGTSESYISLPMGGQIRNVTKLGADTVRKAALTAPELAVKLNAPEDEPQILIMHTHTTESYEPTDGSGGKGHVYRSTDNSENMTAVGRAMETVFEKNGIRTIHDETIHDYPNYNGAYDRSRVTVQELLKKYPSVKVVLDVHRDAAEREDGTRIAPYTVINGRGAAQIMMICGCDDGTMGMPDCMKNLSAAAYFQQYIESSFPTLTRPVLFDYRHYNQDLTTGSLLIEVGGHANYLEEAVYAGELTAEGISRALIAAAE